MFEQRADYAVPLMRLLAELPGGAGTREEVSSRFYRCYRSELPKEHLEDVPSGGQERWEKHLDWANWDMRQQGLTDAPERGIRRLTQAGRDWLNAHPGATRLTEGPERRERTARSRGPGTSKPTSAVVVPPGITLDKLERIRPAISADEFRDDWGEIYDQLLAAERAKTITPVNDRDLLGAIHSLVHQIQDFLEGRGSESPASEVICDWIFVCYNLKLFREGAALWRYVNKDEVNPWLYERTAKYSTACRARVG